MEIGLKPHVTFGAWGGPQHGVSFEPVKKPYHMAHGMGIQFGLCNQLGQFNTIGMVLLSNAYEHKVLKKAHCWDAGNHVVVSWKGIERLLNHHNISERNGSRQSLEIANLLTGQSFTFEDMPGDVDWFGLAKLLSANKNIPI